MDPRFRGDDRKESGDDRKESGDEKKEGGDERKERIIPARSKNPEKRKTLLTSVFRERRKQEKRAFLAAF